MDIVVGLAVCGAAVALAVVTLSGSRGVSRGLSCIDNLRRLGVAAHQYAADFDGRFFPQYLGARTEAMRAAGEDPRSRWCDDARLGRYLAEGMVQWTAWQQPAADPLGRKQAVGGVVRCPQAPAEEARSYAQSHWANALGRRSAPYAADFRWRPEGKLAYPLGEHFNLASGPADRLMLFVETYAQEPSDAGWVTGTVGVLNRPSDRFSGGELAQRGWLPRIDAGFSGPTRYGHFSIPWHVNYSNHGTPGSPLRPVGETHIAFADGHARRLHSAHLYDPKTRQSTYRALWSADDRRFDEIGEPLRASPY